MQDLNGKKVLIVQTAFIGDVILATSLVEKLKRNFPEIRLHFLVRKGNEGLISNNPKLAGVHVWNKGHNKYRELLKIIRQIRAEHFDLVINVQRFLSTGLLTVLSGAKYTVGFKKNPLSLFFTKKYRHKLGDGTHETERNNELIKDFTDNPIDRPSLYTNDHDKKVLQYQKVSYICIAPTSIWYTKQLKLDKWVEFIDRIDPKYHIYLLGGAGDVTMCNKIVSTVDHPLIVSLAGKLSLLESAALQKKAVMNYVNDSAPLHLATAVNAPVVAVYCSTVPEFGFGPLSDVSKIVQTNENLSCRPCGLHGHTKCPQGHFDCANTINTKEMVAILNN